MICASFSSPNPEVGTEIDRLNGIAVYFNGNVSNTFGRRLTADGYNLGLKYQCVEFVKRYYYERFDHKMDETYGHAKDYFDKRLDNADINEARGLYQFKNIGSHKPQLDDIIVFDASEGNPYGHMGIVSFVSDTEIEIVQQNYGQKTRHRMKLVKYKDIWTIAEFDLLGWLRL